MDANLIKINVEESVLPLITVLQSMMVVFSIAVGNVIMDLHIKSVPILKIVLTLVFV